MEVKHKRCNETVMLIYCFTLKYFQMCLQIFTIHQLSVADQLGGFKIITICPITIICFPRLVGEYGCHVNKVFRTSIALLQHCDDRDVTFLMLYNPLHTRLQATSYGATNGLILLQDM